jgi:hypothetical protein
MRRYAVLAVVLALTGCGGGSHLSKKDYSARVTAVFTALDRRIEAAPTGGTQQETSAGLRSIKRALDDAAAALARLKPPPDAKHEHAALVGGTRDYAEQVDLVRASVDLGDPVTIASHLREVTAPAALERAIDALNGKGYRIPVRVVRVR